MNTTAHENEKASRDVSANEARTRLYEIMKNHFDVVLFNQDADGKMHGRPMARARLDEDGTTYYATSIGSQKIAELHKRPEVSLSIQGEREYAVVSGRARISQDRALIDQLWQDSWKIWFEGGKTDPSIAIVIVEPDEGTYWDQTKTQGLSFLWRAAKARITGHEVAIDPGDSQHVSMKKNVRAPGI